MSWTEKMSWIEEMSRVTEVENEARHMMDGSREMDLLSRRCIYRVPAFISNLNKEIYSPHVVSFGPHHHGEVHLEPMESHKMRSLLHFLKNRASFPLKLKDIFFSFAQVEEELKDSYDSLHPMWQSDKKSFLKLMIIDGCFMLEILWAAIKTPDDYHSDDPIFSNHGKLYILPFIKKDMLLLENQLPMLVLDKLLEISGSFHDVTSHEEFMNDLILQFCNFKARGQRMGECLHVLDIYRKSLGSRGDVTRSIILDGDYKMLRSAKQLYDAGVTIKTSENSLCNYGHRNISFEGGVLRLPIFIIDENTESTFLNMIAFERCHVGAGSDMTTFVRFMSSLIRSAEDINVLGSQGVIRKTFGSDRDAAYLIDTISKNSTLDPFDPLHPLAGILWEANNYCEMWQNKCQNSCRVAFANLIENYFSSPWTLISVIAAGVLLGLTMTQTVYSALQYYQGSKKP